MGTGLRTWNKCSPSYQELVADWANKMNPLEIIISFQGIKDLEGLEKKLKHVKTLKTCLKTTTQTTSRRGKQSPSYPANGLSGWRICNRRGSRPGVATSIGIISWHSNEFFVFVFAARFEQDELNITHVQKYAHGVPLNKTIFGGAPFISFIETRIYTCCKILVQTFLVLTQKGPRQTVHFSLSHWNCRLFVEFPTKHHQAPPVTRFRTFNCEKVRKTEAAAAGTAVAGLSQGWEPSLIGGIFCEIFGTACICMNELYLTLYIM